MTRSHEEYVFKAFKELYHDFPVGEYIRDEQPDFVIKTGNKLIGVEITQVFIDNYLNTSLNKKRKENLHKLFGENLCKKLSLIIPYKFVLSIDFSKEKDFSTNQIDCITLACDKYFRSFHYTAESTSLIIENSGQLPEEIGIIELYKFPSLRKSFYSESAAGIIPDLTMQHLNVILNKKDKALKNYRRCDEHWLLIEEGTFIADSFGDVLIDKFSTDFHKVFLYRHSMRELIQLK